MEDQVVQNAEGIIGLIYSIGGSSLVTTVILFFVLWKTGMIGGKGGSVEAPKNKEDSGIFKRVNRDQIQTCPLNPGLGGVEKRLEDLIILQTKANVWLEMLANRAVGVRKDGR